MQALHIKLCALSAAYPYPFLKSGTQLTLPAPPLCSILGHLSACAGRTVRPEETLIGFEFEAAGTAIDLETTRRLKTDSKTGKLSLQKETGIGKREFHVKPVLDLYLTNLNLEQAFYRPVATPCLGRSQDIAWVQSIALVDLQSVGAGRLGKTYVPFPNYQVGGRILPPLADYFLNDHLGYTRRIGKLSRYQFLPEGANVKAASAFELFHPSDSKGPDHVVFLHKPAA